MFVHSEGRMYNVHIMFEHQLKYWVVWNGFNNWVFPKEFFIFQMTVSSLTRKHNLLIYIGCLWWPQRGSPWISFMKLRLPEVRLVPPLIWNSSCILRISQYLLKIIPSPFILNRIDKYSQPKEVGLIKKIAMGPGSQFLLSLTPWYPIRTEYRSMNNIQCQYL
jgi:hypothetical protein